MYMYCSSVHASRVGHVHSAIVLTTVTAQSATSVATLSPALPPSGSTWDPTVTEVSLEERAASILAHSSYIHVHVYIHVHTVQCNMYMYMYVYIYTHTVHVHVDMHVSYYTLYVQ